MNATRFSALEREVKSQAQTLNALKANLARMAQNHADMEMAFQLCLPDPQAYAKAVGQIATAKIAARAEEDKAAIVAQVEAGKLFPATDVLDGTDIVVLKVQTPDGDAVESVFRFSVLGEELTEKILSLPPPHLDQEFNASVQGMEAKVTITGVYSKEAR